MNSKEIDNRITYLELVIFNIKVNINSGNYLSTYVIQKISERNKFKKELWHLKLKKERKQKLKKLEQIYNEN